ncbi:MAG TPA: hypothetical protein VHB79_36130 [Polyangiaceae bacterium]|nr:hypothetical protein [Polyangiaceae bacterium]
MTRAPAWLSAVAMAGSWLLTSNALHAEGREQPQRSAPSWNESVQNAVAAGSYLPLSLAPDLESHGARAGALTGYDGARQAVTFQSFVQASIYGPLGLRVGALSTSAGRVAPLLGARARLLSQDRHGVALAASVFYKTEGFTELEGEIETALSLARRWNQWLVVSTLAYGQDPEGRERDGEVSLAGLFQLSRAAHVGVDARGRFDLGSRRQQLRGANEPLDDVQAGPVLHVALGPVALSAHAGVSAFRSVEGTPQVGVVAAAGLGSAF